jgi:hypothetical protein
MEACMCTHTTHLCDGYLPAPVADVYSGSLCRAPDGVTDAMPSQLYRSRPFTPPSFQSVADGCPPRMCTDDVTDTRSHHLLEAGLSC